jgi:hypothetical protein
VRLVPRRFFAILGNFHYTKIETIAKGLNTNSYFPVINKRVLDWGFDFYKIKVGVVQMHKDKNNNNNSRKNSLSALVKASLLSAALLFSTSFAEEAKSTDNDSVKTSVKTEVKAKDSRINFKDEIKRTFSVHGQFDYSRVDNDNTAKNINAGFGIKYFDLDFDVGDLTIVDSSVSSGPIQNGAYLLNERIKNESNNIGLVAKIYAGNSVFLAGRNNSKQNGDVYSNSNDSIFINNTINGNTVIDSIRQSTNDTIRINTDTKHTMMGVSKLTSENKFGMGLYIGMIENSATNNDKSKSKSDKEEIVIVPYQIINGDTSISNGDTVITHKDTTFVTPPTYSSQTIDTVLNTSSEEKNYLINPFIMFGNGKPFIRIDGIYNFQQKSSKSSPSSLPMKEKDDYTAFSLEAGTEMFSKFLSLYAGAGNRLKDVRTVLGFYVPKSSQVIIDMRGIQSNRMTKDLEENLIAVSSINNTGLLEENVKSFALVNAYNLLNDNTDINQVLLGYEKLDRMNLEGSIAQVALNLILNRTENTQANFIGELKYFDINNQYITKLSPELLFRYGSISAKAGVNLLIAGKETESSAGFGLRFDIKQKN